MHFVRLHLLLMLLCCFAVSASLSAEAKKPPKTTAYEEIRLTNNPVIDTEPVFSPDMKHIAFISVSNEIGCSNLHIMDADGKNRRALVTTAGETNINPVFMPDGERILYVFNRGKTSGFATIKRDGTEMIELLSLDKKVSIPTPSPDGKRIAFLLTDEHQQLHIFDIETKSHNKIQTGAGDCDTPVFSCDGSVLFYVEFDMEGTQLCRVDADGKNRKLLTKPTEEGSDSIAPIPIPDGRVFYMSDTREGFFQVMAMKADGTEKQVVLKESVFIYTVSPDGMQIVYLFAIRPNKNEFFIFDVKTSKSEQLTDNLFKEKSVRFSPDGKWILYVSDLEGNPEVYKMKIAK